MQTKDFYFDLPEELVAQHPSGSRGEDRLMRLGRFSGEVSHHAMRDLPALVEAGTVMVFNNSKVRRSRCYALPLASAASKGSQAPSKEVEFLLLNSLDFAGQPRGAVWRAMARNAKRQRCGRRFRFADGTLAEILPNAADEGTEFRTLLFEKPVDEAWFERNGHIPLPPYIKRADVDEDSERYQTIYARETGSAAAPTAGLHFTQGLLDELSARGVQTAYVTLHVGLGTFLPVRTAKIEDHKMHEETFTISDGTAEIVEKAKREGRPVLAVGTTSLRTLESAWNEGSGRLERGTRSTSIFIYPGYSFKVVDKLFTNFHTPESTLLMLVSAFAGRERILAAYGEAVKSRYRFFSYGDAMLIG